jgi:hypothetical protein
MAVILHRSNTGSLSITKFPTPGFKFKFLNARARKVSSCVFFSLCLSATYSEHVNMAKARKKKRTHVRTDAAPGKGAQGNRRPKSMVIRMGAGDIGPSVTQLARDFRTVMEPDTASRLKVDAP